MDEAMLIKHLTLFKRFSSVPLCFVLLTLWTAWYDGGERVPALLDDSDGTLQDVEWGQDKTQRR